MASQDESTRRGGGKREDSSSWGFCALCFLTLGTREKRVPWGEGFAHPSCVAKLGGREAA